MDRMIHTALNSLKVAGSARTVTAQNLSSMTVPGYRKDLPKLGGSAFVQSMDQATARVMNLSTGESLFSSKPGTLQQLGVDTDVAIMGDGYFFVQPKKGDVALSRRGDFSLNEDGFLVNAASELMLDEALQPIEIPPFQEIQITEIGEISVVPLDAPQGQFQNIGILATTIAENEQLIKNEDGQIRKLDGGVPEPDQRAKVVQGALEASNVDPVDELIRSIETQRHFEIGVKFIKMAEDIDRGGSELMRLPQN